MGGPDILHLLTPSHRQAHMMESGFEPQHYVSGYPSGQFFADATMVEPRRTTGANSQEEGEELDHREE